MPPKAQKAGADRLIGYARVSTEGQGTDPQTDGLGAAGCTTVHEEHAFGAERSRRYWPACCATSPSARRWSWFASTPRPFGQPSARGDRAAGDLPAYPDRYASSAGDKRLSSLLPRAAADTLADVRVMLPLGRKSLLTRHFRKLPPWHSTQGVLTPPRGATDPRSVCSTSRGCPPCFGQQVGRGPHGIICKRGKIVGSLSLFACPARRGIHLYGCAVALHPL
jgi:hypothetical protein